MYKPRGETRGECRLGRLMWKREGRNQQLRGGGCARPSYHIGQAAAAGFNDFAGGRAARAARLRVSPGSAPCTGGTHLGAHRRRGFGKKLWEGGQTTK